MDTGIMGTDPSTGRVCKADLRRAADALGLQILDRAIQVGDLYLAGRNTGVKLLTCREVEVAQRFIVPTTIDYCYDTWECVPVVETEQAVVESSGDAVHP